MSSKAKSVVFFTLCFVFGLSVFFSISEDLIIQREPAAIDGKIFQIASLSSEQIKEHLLQKLRVLPTMDGKKSIQLNGFSASLCKSYPEIEMEFQGEGIAVGGEAPTMKVTAPCESGQDPSEIASIQFPVEKILLEKPKNSEYKFSGFNGRFEFKNAADAWPRQWVLKSVQFKSAGGVNKVAHFAKWGDKNSSSKNIVLEF